ncbi:MAG: hypothetical protein P8J59_12545 [Phycisphaerales bacterium]|jgi:hypothetical protein|nr:hypothetical protein [Phycisphaerales bacterium]
MNPIGPHHLARLVKPVMLGSFLAVSPVLGQTAVPGQTTRPSAAPPTKQMASSRFAPNPGTIRELQMIGEAAPPPPTGTMIKGDSITGWNTTGPTILLFWSPFVGGTGAHLAQLGDVGAKSEKIETISIASGPRSRVEDMLDNLPGRTPIAPRTILDDTGQWRQAFVEPLGLTTLPAVVALDASGEVVYHGPMNTASIALAKISSNNWSSSSYRNSVLEYNARKQASIALNEMRGRVRRGQATPEEAIALAEELIELDPRNGGRQVSKFDTLLTLAGRPDDAYAYGREIAERFPDNYLILNDLAWNTVSLPDVSRRDLDFALEMSRRANAIQGYADHSVLDTLARVWWMRGDADEAIRWQLKAVARAFGTWHGDSTRANLDAYTNGYLKPGELPPPYSSPRRR